MAKTISHSFAALTREILFLPLEHKIHIFLQPYNILYIYLHNFSKINLFDYNRVSSTNRQIMFKSNIQYKKKSEIKFCRQEYVMHARSFIRYVYTAAISSSWRIRLSRLTEKITLLSNFMLLGVLNTLNHIRKASVYTGLYNNSQFTYLSSGHTMEEILLRSDAS